MIAQHGPITNHKVQGIFGNACLVQELYRPVSDQGRLYGWFGNHRIARGQSGGDLAHKNCQREIPRGYTGHDAKGDVLFGIQKIGLIRIIAAKIYRFANFGDGIGNGFAGFPHAKLDKLIPARLQKIGGAAQTAAGPFSVAPLCPIGFLGQINCHIYGLRPCIKGLADFDVLIKGRPDSCGGALPLSAPHDRGCHIVGCLGQERLQGVGLFGLGPVHPLGGEARHAKGILGWGDDIAIAGSSRLHPFNRVTHQGCNIGFVVSKLIDERGISPVFQQAAHQIGQQIAMLADRGINAAGHPALVHKRRMQAFSHAVQALKLKSHTGFFGHIINRQRGLCIMGGELGINLFWRTQHFLRTGQIADIGVVLACKNRIAGQAQFLRAL